MPALHLSATAAKMPLSRNSSTTRNRWVSKVAVVVVSADKDSSSGKAIAIIVTTDAAVAINADADSVAVVAAGVVKDKDNSKVADNAASAASNARHSRPSCRMVRR